MDAHDRRGSASIDNPDSHELRCKRLSNDAILPTRTHDTDAGWDLYSSGDQFIMPGRWGLVDTGISMEIPKGYAGLIWPRSGLAVKKGVDVFAGVQEVPKITMVEVEDLNGSKRGVGGFGSSGS